MAKKIAALISVKLDGVKKEILQKLKEPERMRKYAQIGADAIKLRTRLGSSVSAPGEVKEPLKPLSPAYKEQRKALKAEGKLSEFASPGKSNLTLSGQLLDSVKVISAIQGKAIVGPSGSRNDGKTNEDVGKYVTKAGRPFNNPSDSELKRIQDAVKRELRALIKLTKGK
jgi:hypothetical protein